LDRFCLLAWLEPVHACRHPTFALSPRPGLWGRRSKPSCCTSTLLRPIESILYARSLIGQLSQPACTLFVNPWLCQRVYRLMQVASHRLPVPSACTNQTRCSFRRQPAIRTIPLRRSLRPCGFLAPPSAAGDWTSSAPATVARNSIMRHRPLSRRRSAIGSEGFGLTNVSPVFRLKDSRLTPATLLGFLRPFAALILSLQVEDQSSCVLVARLPFHKSPPRQILVGGSTARSARPCFSIANRSWPLIAASGHANLRQAGDD
jgi:hypothetical protein